MKNLLVAIDFSKATEPVLVESIKLAKALNAKVWALHVASAETQTFIYDSTQFTHYAPEYSSMPGDVQLARELSADELKREHAELLAISARLRSEGLEAHALLVKGDAAKMILEKAASHDCDMIILGSHGHGFLRKALLGSVSEAVTHHAKRNVLIVPMAGK